MKKKLQAFLSWLLILCVFLAPSQIVRADELPKLPAPTGLKWSDEVHGGIEFNPVNGSGGEYSVELYRDDKQILKTTSTGIYDGKLDLSRKINESGTYTFSVIAEGDGIINESSDPVSCDDTYVYVKPNQTVEAATNLQWSEENSGVVSWDPVAGAGRYEVELFRRNSKNGIEQRVIGILTVSNEYDFSKSMDKTGFYTFSVRALSSDIEVFANGVKSAKSPLFDSRDVVNVISEQLEEAMLASPSDAREIVANEMDQSQLVIAMQSSEDVRNQISNLEKKYITDKKIDYKTNIEEGLFSGNVSIIGASLNLNGDNEIDPEIASSSNARNKVSVNFSKAEPNYDYDDASTYGNAIAMDISLLINEVECHELQIPIRIKVPVPNDIKPSRLVIYHERSDGREMIKPQITYENNKAYATFVVTDLSVFVFAEEGDGNSGNGGSDSGSSSGGGSSSGSSSSGSSSYIWQQNENGWWIVDKNGNYPTSAWKQVKGIWYYFDETGYMTTGWQLVNGKWYFMQSTGAMVSNNWVLNSGKWYFLNSDGSMATGWIQWKDQWYYLEGTKGEMLVNTVTPDGYHVKDNGVWEQ